MGPYNLHKALTEIRVEINYIVGGFPAKHTHEEQSQLMILGLPMYSCLSW